MQKYAKYSKICKKYAKYAKICKNMQKYAKCSKICKTLKNMQKYAKYSKICKKYAKYAKISKNMQKYAKICRYADSAIYYVLFNTDGKFFLFNHHYFSGKKIFTEVPLTGREG